MSERIKQLQFILREKGLDAFLVTNSINVSYLTGINSEDAWLLVCVDRNFYLTDPRYELYAKKILKQVHVKIAKDSLYRLVSKIAIKRGLHKIGIDEKHLNLWQYRKLKQSLVGIARLINATGIVEILREVKDKYEIRLIRKALKIHKLANIFLHKIIEKGKREKDILCELEDFIRERADGFSFPPIIASGINSCYPHAKPTQRRIKANDVILVDMGVDIGGYKSDLTRMFFLGKIPPLIQECFSIVRFAQKQAISAIKPGVFCSDVDRVARNCLRENKLDKYFIHSLGHGVGLEIHESPYLSQNSNSKLREGMVLTVEPAVYIPNKFGIRVEDMVLVTKNGCEVLSDDID